MLQCKSFSGLRQTRAMIRTLHSPQRPQWPQWPQCSFFKDILHIAVPAQNVSLQAFGSRLNSKSNSNRVNKSFPKARTEGVCFDMQKPKRSTTFTALRLNHKAKLPLHRHCQKWPGRLACRRMSSHVVACRRMSSHVVACRRMSRTSTRTRCLASPPRPSWPHCHRRPWPGAAASLPGTGERLERLERLETRAETNKKTSKTKTSHKSSQVITSHHTNLNQHQSDATSTHSDSDSQPILLSYVICPYMSLNWLTSSGLDCLRIVGRSFGLNRQHVLCALCYTHFRGLAGPTHWARNIHCIWTRWRKRSNSQVAFDSFNAVIARHVHYGAWSNSTRRVLRNAWWLKLAILVVFLCLCIALHRKFFAFCKDKFRIGAAVAKCVAFDLGFQDISNQLTLVFPRCSVKNVQRTCRANWKQQSKAVQRELSHVQLSIAGTTKSFEMCPTFVVTL